MLNELNQSFYNDIIIIYQKINALPKIFEVAKCTPLKNCKIFIN